MSEKKQRVGIGYDAHPFAPGRKLILGGQDIPFDKGLDGWSDADALVHAIIEALLGAAALGDIGQHFPPGDPRFKGIASLALLKEVARMLHNKGWNVGNIDATMIAESPRLSVYAQSMKKAICHTLDVDATKISVKAKSSGGLGFIGRGEGIAVIAVAMVESK